MTSFGGFSFGVAAAEDDHDDHDDSEVKSPNSSSLQVPVSRGRRQTVSAEVYDASKEEEEFHPEEYPKSAEDAEKLTKVFLVSIHLWGSARHGIFGVSTPW